MRLSIGKCWGLLIFDLVGLAIAGYAYLLGFQILQTLPHANALIILMAFFIGIKIVILALYDLNRNLMLKNIPFIAGLITILGNAIIFGISFFLISEVPYYFFIGLAIADFIMITFGHFLWWIIIGKEKNEKRPKEEKKEAKKSRQKDENEKPSKSKKRSKDQWLSQESNEDEYDSIFDALLQKNQNNQNKINDQEEKDTLKPPIPARNIFEEEKKYETGEFLKDIRKSRNQSSGKPVAKSQFDQDTTIKGEVEPVFEIEPIFNEKPFDDQKSQSFTKGSVANKLMINESLTKESMVDELMTENSVKRSDFEGDKLNFGENSFAIEEKDKKYPAMENKAQTSDIPLMDEANRAFDQVETDSQPVKNETSTNEELKRQEPEKSVFTHDISFGMDDDDNDFTSIEKRLGHLFNEIEMSMEETQYLQEAISVFQEEVKSYKPIKGDEKIVAAGSLIREKLKAIIDKQFVVDEVLDDLIHLSKVINKRIDDLDRIETGLNKRKASLDQKEEILLGKKPKMKDQKLEILPEELTMENLDSEYIVPEADYEIIQRYLNKIK